MSAELPPQVPRSYDDPCGVARALDLVGERWALLVVRELLLGPKRFTDLRRGLPGASQNVLSHRLRELERAGVVRRDRLGPPAGARVYELTERGRCLEPVLLELGRWGSRAPTTSTADLGVDALMLALRTTFDPDAAAGIAVRLELRVDGDRFDVEVAGGRLAIERGRPARPDATVTAGPATLRALAFGRARLDGALSAGEASIEGDRRAAARFLSLFRAPSPA